MAKKNIFKNKSLWKKIGLGCLAGALTIGAIAGVSALVKESEETTKIINPTYAVGGLTENGAYLETEGSLYTENAFECQGLDVELDFKSNVSYRIFFYDSENDFMSSTEKLTGNYDETTTPIFADYARIVITPNEDEEIKWYEKSGYANQLTISVNKEQTSVVERVTALTDNKAVVLGQGSWDTVNGTGFSETTTPFYFFDKVDVSNADTMIMKVKTETLSAVLSYASTTFSVPMIYNGETEKVISLTYETLCEVDDCTYIAYDVSDYNSIFGCVDVQSVDFVEIYVV